MYFRKKQSGGRVYLQIVESRRIGDRVRQQVIATLGRFDELAASGQLERLLRSGARFAAQALASPGDAEDRGNLRASGARRAQPLRGLVRLARPGGAGEGDRGDRVSGRATCRT
jgi:hypothetical protein